QIVHVGADREGTGARRRQYGDALLGTIEGLEGLLQLDRHRTADGVELFGPIDADDRDQPLLLHGHYGCDGRHGSSFLHPSNARASTMTQPSPARRTISGLISSSLSRPRKSCASQPSRTTASTTTSISSGARPRSPRKRAETLSPPSIS